MTFIDQLNNEITLAHTPKRIVSLVPSQTELLFDLGVGDSIVGITNFCIHPAEKCMEKEKIGGTKKFNIEKIRALQPDLIIGNKEENYQEGIELLQREFPVWMSDIYNLTDALAMIQAIGEIVGKLPEAVQMTQEIRDSFDTLKPIYPPLKVAYFIWRKPYMVAGNDTYINELLKTGGFDNVFARLPRYPSITMEDLEDTRPDWIMLSSEPYPFKEKHFAELQTICPHARVSLVDGEMFSWYGSRLRLVVPYLKRLSSKAVK
jgi:ABC-type Fe3+-hydroxamate transport system substrate-binding protein